MILGGNLGPGSANSWWQRRSARLIVALVTLLIVVGILSVVSRRSFKPRPSPIASTLQPMPVAVAPGIYLLGKCSPAAVYLVETEKGLVLIDSGKESDASVVLSQVVDLQFDIKSLQAILLTHVHADHSLGSAHLRSLTGAKIYAGREDVGPLQDGGPREAFVSTFHMPNVQPHPTSIDVELAGGETLEFGGTSFTALAAPGHTPGSMCYLLERDNLRVLFAGDVIVSLSGNEPLGTYVGYLPPRFRGSARDYLSTLKRLASMPVPDLVLPGHPRMDAAPQNPHLTQEYWQRLLQVGITEMERLLARHETDGADFLDGTPKELVPELQYLGNLGLRAMYCLKSPKGLMLFNAPRGDELLPLFTRRLQELGWDKEKLTAVFVTSTEPESISGLPAIVQKTGCRVFAPKSAREDIRRQLPATAEVLSAEDSAASELPEGRVLVLAGRSKESLGYFFRWEKRMVLVTGRIPLKPSVPGAQELQGDINGPGGSAAQYIRSLDQLRRIVPNLWLPAVPVHGQNANLYDQEWERLLAQNLQLVR